MILDSGDVIELFIKVLFCLFLYIFFLYLVSVDIFMMVKIKISMEKLYFIGFLILFCILGCL